ncbi:hypothetical protein PA7_35250 [Pseudonocardia asaccharolytica DSM 44247 = NBRC 16224]|uniref:Uncharacterized protein n=1 Tax=Pseudonocardia asaccharolytica DSM 44247 = NBRC 16224 TaxID=1123024 RepID=A0A511D9R5_9PSEU|nr:hypothetical protein PA7_35250 [Pseudonocardia asaccharolytica DSM 44247 = NBRC 16224]
MLWFAAVDSDFIVSSSRPGERRAMTCEIARSTGFTAGDARPTRRNHSRTGITVRVAFRLR